MFNLIIKLIIGVLIILICVLPGFKYIPTHLPDWGFIKNIPMYMNFYMWYKGILIKICSSITIIHLVYILRNSFIQKFSENKSIFILFFILITHLTISTIFSKYFYYSFFGYYNQNQGYLIELSYLIIFMYMALNNYENFYLTICFISLIICLIISYFQYYNHFYLNSDFIKKFIPGYDPSKNIVPYFGNGSFTSSFGNPNYMGSFLSIFIPVTSFLFIFKKNIISKLFFIFLSSASYLGLIISESRAGFIGIIISFTVFSIFFFRNIKEHYISIITLILILFSISYFQKSNFSRRFLVSKNEILDVVNPKNYYKKIELINKDNYLKYKFNEHGILIYLIHNKMYFFNAKGEYIKYTSNQNKSEFYPTPSQHFVLKNDNSIYDDGYKFIDENHNVSFLFKKEGLGFKFIHPTFFTIFDAVQAKTLFPKTLDSLFSYRAYIWSRSLPLVLERPILGHGLQTFGLIFPNNDLEGRLNVGLDLNIVFDKAHSWYVQILCELGIFGLIIYLLFILIPFYPMISIWKKPYLWSECTQLYISLSSGALAYCIASIFTDSWNGVTIFFWLILGLLYSLGKNYKQQIQ